MIYFIIVAIVIVAVVTSLYAMSKRRRREQIAFFRTTWGFPRPLTSNFNRIGRYAVLPHEDASHKLSQQTLDDIDFYQLFEFVDRTTSPIGKQYLFKKLLHPYDPPEALLRMHAIAEIMTNNPTLREKIYLELIKLDQPDSFFICDLIRHKLVERPWWFKYLKFNLMLAFALAMLGVIFPVCLVFLIVPLGINTGVHYWNKNNMSAAFSSFSQLGVLISVSGEILKKGSFDDATVRNYVRALKPFQWKLMLMNRGSGQVADDLGILAYYVAEVFKAFFLVEVYTVFSIANELAKKENAVSGLFSFVGEIDSAISIASLRAGSRQTCVPDLVTTRKEIEAKGLYHPLIKNCVKNDIHIHDKSVLITGSNMSGKTTFLRTVIINSILAQSIYTCFGDVFKSPLVKQFSSIRIDDNLFQGRSYFLEEVNTIGSFIEQSEADQQNLFVVDEVFKGTNSIERVALAKAVLSYLNRGNNIVLVSTHDLELSAMLKDSYSLYHFTETIENGALHFDHVLKPGPLKTTNAITLLEFANFPAEIISEARALTSVSHQGFDGKM